MKKQRYKVYLKLCVLALMSVPERDWAQETPEVRITEMTMLPGASCRLTVTAPYAGLYELQSSADLRTWSSAVTTNLNAPGQLVFTIPTVNRAEFFRVGKPADILLRWRAGAPDDATEAAAAKAHLVVEDVIATGGMDIYASPPVLLGRTDLPINTALALLVEDSDDVEFAEPNAILTATDLPNDPRYLDGSLWGMYGSGTTPANAFGSAAAAAWQAGFTGSRATYVGVVDTGIQIDHPDLAPNIWTNPGEIPGNGIDDDGNGFVDDVHGWNFANQNPQVYGGLGDDHGTHVAGTIGAVGNNGQGVVGINWAVTMIPVKLFGQDGRATTKNAVKAIDYLTQLKMRYGLNLVAINCSWGGYVPSRALREAVLRAAKADILVVAAAGNESSNNDLLPHYPSNYDTTQATRRETNAAYNAAIAVAAIDDQGECPWWSNFGATNVHLGAPGVRIWSTVPPSSYAVLTPEGYEWSGTSMAAAQVTGAAALYASRFPGTSAKDIRGALLSRTTGTASLQGKTSTGGRLNVSNALGVSGTPPARPAAPSNLVAQVNPDTGEVLLTWQDHSTNELGFRIERHASDPTFQPLDAVAADRTAFTDKGTATNTLYYYRLRAFNAVGDSDWSNEAQAFVPNRAPRAPSDPVATETSAGNVRLSWRDNSTDETGFQVERSTDGVQFTLLTNAPPNIGDTTRIIDMTVTTSRTYYYRVLAVRGAERSVPSPVVSIRVVDLRAPSGLSLQVNSDGNVEAAWTDNTSDEIKFELWRSTDGTSFALEENVGQMSGIGSRVSAADTTVTLGQTYWYKVRAVRGSRPTDFSPTASISVPPFVPGAPTALTLQLTSGRDVQATWTDNSTDEYQFEIQRSANGVSFSHEENVGQVAGSGSRVSAVDTTIDNDGGMFWYRVRAFRLNHPSAYPTDFSNTNSIVVPTRAPTSLTVQATSAGDVQATWTDNTTDEDHFELYRSTDGSNFSKEENVGMVSGSGSQVSAVDTTVALGGTYWYKVRAIRSIQPTDTAFSSTVTITVPSTVPGAPTDLVLALDGNDDVKATWTDQSSDEDHFELYRSTDGSHFSKEENVGQKSGTGSRVSATDTTVTPNTSYWYKVRAIRRIQYPTQYVDKPTSFSNTKAITTP